MFWNYLKIALRNIRKNIVFSFINITGLTVGITCVIFILIYVQDEQSYDRFHENADDIYHVLSYTDKGPTSVTPTSLAPELKNDFPEVAAFSRYHWFWAETVIEYENKLFTENGIGLVDPSFFNIFTFPIIKGNPEKALQDPYSIVITEKIAQKYFGNEDPIGKVFTLNRDHKFTVTAVMQDVPHNSTLRFDMLIPIQFTISIYDNWYMDWKNLFVFTFIKCQAGMNVAGFNKKIAGVVRDQSGDEHISLAVLPFTDRYFFFYSEESTIFAFLSVAGFILIIACFNFMNLSTARAAKRAKEIGLRKIIGSSRRQIIFQFLIESVLLSVIAGILGLILVLIMWPLFLTITGKEIILHYPFIVSRIFGVALFTGLLAGSIPSVFFSNFSVINMLKGKPMKDFKGDWLRKAMVLVQFALSILLIIGLLIVYQQKDYIQNKDIGYNKDKIVSIPMGGGSEKHYQLFKKELLKNDRIEGVTGTGAALPFFSWRISGFHWEGKDPNEKISISYNEVDYDFIETLQLHLLEGTAFSRKITSDASACLLVNEEMVKLMNLSSVIGVTIMRGDFPGKVVGVINNFHFNSLENKIEPLILELNPAEVDNLLIRIQPEDVASTISLIEKTWKEVIPGYPLRYSFLNDDYNSSLIDLSRTEYLLGAFSALAIFISCLGLFGLSFYAVECRTKEIGVRKVLGASVQGILMLLGQEFLKWILLANVVAWPLAYYVMNKWLQNFAYHTSIGWGIFFLAGSIALAVSLFTISWQIIRASWANPVDSLRYE